MCNNTKPYPRSWLIYFGLALLSGIGGCVSSCIPPSPAWTSLEHHDFVLGITDDGRLVTRSKDAMIVVSQVESGAVMARYPIPAKWFSGLITDDGEHAVIRTSVSELIVVSLRNGRVVLRHSMPETVGPVLIRDALDYLIQVDQHNVTGSEVIEVSSGRVLWSTDESLTFFHDDQLVLGVRTSQDGWLTDQVVLRSVKDGAERARISVPIPEGYRLFSVSSRSDRRIEFEFKRSIDKVRISDIWSSRLVENSLIEWLREGRIETSETDGSIFDYKDGLHLEITRSNALPDGRLGYWIYSMALRLGLIRSFSTGEFALKLRSIDRSGDPRGPKLHLKSMSMGRSPDSKWLAVAGGELEVYSLPMSWPWRLIGTCIAMPWLLWWMGRCVWKCRTPAIVAEPAKENSNATP